MGEQCEATLTSAALEGDVELVETLLNEGADIETKIVKGSDAEKTALMLASEVGHLKVVQVLLERGANTEAKGRSDWTPLMLAANSGHREVVLELIQKGADRNAKTKGGIFHTPSTAADVAANKEIAEIIGTKTPKPVKKSRVEKRLDALEKLSRSQ